MVVVRLALFVVLSIPIVVLSWRSLRDPRLHGFFRFFAFECLLALVLINVSGWFHNPFSPQQIVSWALLIVSLFLAIHSFSLLHAIGRPQGAIENTTVLVRRGAYRLIRHPLYSSLLCLGWGAFFKQVSLVGGLLALVATVSLYATARVEEEECLRKFGDEYATYMRTTRRFIPFLF